jgi:amino acid transporter
MDDRDASELRQYGYAQQLRRSLVNPHFGFFVGWLLTLQFLTGFPGVCATLAAQVGSWLGGRWAEGAGWVGLTLAVIGLMALVHLFGIRLASRVNDVSVGTELLGVAVLSLVLIGVALARGAAPAVLLHSTDAATRLPAGVNAWALSLPVWAWCLTGFEAASGRLAFVAKGQRTPRNAILFIWAVASAVVLGLPTLDIITQISAVAGYLGYAGIVIAALRAPRVTRTDGFRLGRARRWVGAAALVWVLGVVAALTLPPTPLAGIETEHLPVLSMALAVLVGVGLYVGLVRPRLQRGEAGPPAAAPGAASS